MRVHRDSLKAIMRVGLPAGLQGSVFSISNVLIQSSINSFGSVVMAGCAASGNLEGFVYTSMNSVYQACLTFVGQNVGARQYHRARRILWICLGTVTLVGMGIGGLFYAFAGPLLSVYNTDPEVIRQGMIRMHIICSTYFLCGVMEVLTGQLRGLGYSVLPMIMSLSGVCGIRILWILTVFVQYHTLDMLVVSYPLSWLATALFHAATYYFVQRRFPRRDEALPENAG
jgi:Na+-driven multidrug efflux pump